MAILSPIFIRHRSTQIKIAEGYETWSKRPPEMFGCMLFDRETLTVHTWIECVVLDLQRFSLVKSKTIFRHFKHKIIV